MEYRYVGLGNNQQMVKGVVSANDEKMASEILGRWGYQVLQLKRIEPLRLLSNLQRGAAELHTGIAGGYPGALLRVRSEAAG